MYSFQPTIRPVFRPHYWSLLLVALLGILTTSSCAYVTYEQAQRHFTAAAIQTNNEILGLDTDEINAGLEGMYRTGARPATGDVLPTAEGQFNQAREKLRQSLKKEAVLKEDGVLGNVRTLLALTEWQLNNAEAAREEARLARNVFATKPEDGAGGRDHAMAYAVDGLIIINEVYDSIQLLLDLPLVEASDSAATTLLLVDFLERRAMIASDGSLAGALNIIEEAVGKVSRSRPTIAYLRSAQMAALQNWRTLLNRLGEAGRMSRTFSRQAAVNEAYRAAEQKLLLVIEDYRKKLLEAAPNGQNDPLYQFWRGKVFR